MSKNLIIGILAALLILGSLWGQVGNKSKKAVEHELKTVESRLEEVQAEGTKAGEALLAKTAKMQKTLQLKEDQLAKARQELIALRKGSKGLEAQLSERDAAVAALTQEKNALTEQISQMNQARDAAAGNDQAQVAGLQQQVKELKNTLAQREQQLAKTTKDLKETKDVKLEQKARSNEELQARLEKAETTVKELEEKLAVAVAAADQTTLVNEYESVRAQVIGLEKIIEEKNGTIEETSRELDQWKVNMDVLLSRISELQDSLQELRGENRSLVQEIAAKNRAIADLHEQLIQTPVQE